jgi:pimeloyl-ACP methyl ester carboxylesterase
MPWRETPAELERAWAEQAHIVPCSLGDLVAIFTPPAPAAPPADRCVIFFSRPRFENRRTLVEAARCLAACGFGCIRFDYHGWGDSEGSAGMVYIDEPYRDDCLAVLRYARKTLGFTKFIVWGGCFDARTAISLFPDEGDAIVGLGFFGAPITDWMGSEAYNPSNLIRVGLQWQRIRELVLSARARERALIALRIAFNRIVMRYTKTPPVSPVFLRDFKALLKSQARALFYYGADDEEYQLSFKLKEPELFDRLDQRSRNRLEVRIVPGRAHTVLEAADRERLLNHTFEWIKTLHPHPYEAPDSAAAVG